MNYVKQLFKNTGIIAIGKIGTQVISFVLLPLYTSLLSTSSYGEYDYIVALSTFIVPIISLSMEDSMFRFLIDVNNEEKKKVMSTTLVYFLFAILVLFIFTVIFNRFLAYDNINYLIAYVLSCMLIGLVNATARGNSNIKLYAFGNFCGSIIIILLNILFVVFLKFQFEGLILSTVISNFTVAIFIFVFSGLDNYSLHYFDFKILKEMLSYSLPLVPNNLSWSIINVSDRLFIVKFLNNAANGIYAIANKFPLLLNTFFGFFILSWKEISAKLIKEKNSSYLFFKLYFATYQLMLSISILLIIVTSVIFPYLISINYYEGYYYVPFLIIATFYLNISNYIGGIFTAYKETKIIGKTTICGSLINIIINLFFISYIGLWAATLSTLVSNYVVFRIRLKKVNFNKNDYDKKKIYILWILLCFSCVFYYIQINYLSILLFIFDCCLIAFLYRKIFLEFLNHIRR